MPLPNRMHVRQGWPAMHGCGETRLERTPPKEDPLSSRISLIGPQPKRPFSLARCHANFSAMLKSHTHGVVPLASFRLEPPSARLPSSPPGLTSSCGVQLAALALPKPVASDVLPTIQKPLSPAPSGPALAGSRSCCFLCCCRCCCCRCCCCRSNGCIYFDFRFDRRR